MCVCVCVYMKICKRQRATTAEVHGCDMLVCTGGLIHTKKRPIRTHKTDIPDIRTTLKKEEKKSGRDMPSAPRPPPQKTPPPPPQTQIHTSSGGRLVSSAERGRGRGRGRGRKQKLQSGCEWVDVPRTSYIIFTKSAVFVCVCVCIYIYIYISYTSS
jgi:hypothetical protein